MAVSKNTSVAFAEFLGTGILSLVVLSVTKSDLGVPFFIALALGVATAGLLLALGNMYGSLQLNPAITIGLAFNKHIKPSKAVLRIACQLAGSFIALRLYAYLSTQRWHNYGHFNSRVLIAEAVGTTLLTMGYLAARHQQDTFKASAMVGVAYSTALLAVSGAGGAILNPALALSVGNWVWGSYVAGPIIGALAGVKLYEFFAQQNVSPTVKTITKTDTTTARQLTNKRVSL